MQPRAEASTRTNGSRNAPSRPDEKFAARTLGRAAEETSGPGLSDTRCSSPSKEVVMAGLAYVVIGAKTGTRCMIPWLRRTRFACI